MKISNAQGCTEMRTRDLVSQSRGEEQTDIQMFESQRAIVSFEAVLNEEKE